MSTTKKSNEIIAANVSKTFGAGPFAKEVIKDCSFTIESGKLTVMIGPSGCGKSSLIQLIAGFDQPTSGSITIGGQANRWTWKRSLSVVSRIGSISVDDNLGQRHVRSTCAWRRRSCV